MNRQDWDEVMYSAVAETLENMAFMEVLQSDGPPETFDNAMQVCLLVHDPAQGEFCMTIPEEAIAEIGENILGPDIEEMEGHPLHDILAELLNTIIGRFLTDILHENVTFKLGIPVISQDEVSLKEDAFLWHYIVEDAPFSLAATGESLLQLCSGDKK
ncbi:MAG: chemotaxis protein CheX [Desulfobulbaceae bacterium]|nr:chemotaxis protein CheX [Desulfobulbaceae bacterium]